MLILRIERGKAISFPRVHEEEAMKVKVDGVMREGVSRGVGVGVYYGECVDSGWFCFVVGRWSLLGTSDPR